MIFKLHLSPTAQGCRTLPATRGDNANLKLSAKNEQNNKIKLHERPHYKRNRN